MSGPSQHYRPDIDGLRAIAVLLVIGFHAFPKVVHGGFVGVDVFFVISGFLISGIILEGLARGSFGSLDFYSRRIKRIFPALAVVLAACIPLGWAFCFPGDYLALGKYIATGAGFIANFALFNDAGYFDTVAELKPLLHLWSLGVEEQFYIVWPLMIVIAARWRGGATAVAAFVLLASFAANVIVTDINRAAAFFLPFTRFWELMVGCLLACLAAEGRILGPGGHVPRTETFHNLAAAAGLSLVLGTALLLTGSAAFPGWWALMPTIGAGLLVVTPKAWINRRLLGHPGLVAVGLISYPLYLWHWPLLTFTHLARMREPTELMKVGAIVAAFLLAHLTYRLIERPIRFGARTAWKPVGAALVMVAIGSFGLFIYARDGFPERFPPEALIVLASQDLDWTAEYRHGTCFLGPNQDATQFTGACDQARGPDMRSVFLWGDSHAAHLYPGLALLGARRGFALAQYTSAACPPILSYAGHENPHCGRVNALVLDRIKVDRPETVIMAANWSRYDGNEGRGAVDAAALREAVAALRSIGVRRIVLVGQFPLWLLPPPKILVSAYLDPATRVKRGRSIAPERDTAHLNPSTFAVNAATRQAVEDTGAIFVSPADTLCNPDGCRLSVPGGAPIAADYGHLTVPGSDFFVQQAAHELTGE